MFEFVQIGDVVFFDLHMGDLRRAFSWQRWHPSDLGPTHLGSWHPSLASPSLAVRQRLEAHALDLEA